MSIYAPSASIYLKSAWALLPAELWDEITPHLAHGDLSRLNLVCRSTHRVTQRRLYEKIAWHIIEGSKSRFALQIPFLLLRTLIMRPDLAAYVRHAEFSSFFKELEDPQDREGFRLRRRNWKSPIDELFDHVEATKVIDFIQASGLPNTQSWLEDLYQGCTDVVIACVLCQLPALQTLHCDVPWKVRQRGFIGCIFKHALSSWPKQCGIPTFTNLYQVQMSVKQRKFYLDRLAVFDLDQAAPLFCLPSLTTLTLMNVVCEGGYIWQGDRPFCPKLQRLTVKNSALNEDGLCELLKAAPNLSFLDVTLSYHNRGQGGSHFDGEKTGEALQLLENKIESLALSLNFEPLYEDGSMPPSWGIATPITSLKGFGKLKSLATAWKTLVGEWPLSIFLLCDILPNQLETLRFLDEVRWDDDQGGPSEGPLDQGQFLPLLTEYLSGDSQLKELSFDAEITLSDWGRLAPVRAACKGSGTNLLLKIKS